MVETEVQAEKSAGKKQRKAAVKAAKQAEAEKPKRSGFKKTHVPQGGPSFWQKVKAIAKDDWGSRAHVYLYRLEPIIDRTRGGGATTFVDKYAEPINEERVLADYGSGRYKVILNFRKPGAEQGDEIDSLYIDLLNLKYPPKVPPGEWVDDPRNKKWAWAKQHFSKETGSSNAGETIMDAIEIVNGLRGQQTDPVKTTLDTIRGVRDLLPQPAAKDPTQELSTVVQVAKDLAALQRPPDTKGADDWIRAELSAARERSDKLMMMLLDRKKGNDDGNGFSVVREVIGGIKDLLPEVKSIFPGLSLGEDGGGKSRLNGWQEFALGMAPHISPWVTPFAGMIAQVLTFRMQQAAMQAQPGQPAAPQAPGGGPPAPHPAGLAPPAMMPFLQMIANPMLNFARDMTPPSKVAPAEAGAALAEWVFNGFGESPQYPTALIASRAMGPVGVIAAFRGVPALWTDKGPDGRLASLAEMEPQLPAFFQAFLAWEPEHESDDEPDEPQDPATPEVLTYHEGVEGAAGY